jgi:hypothetical protein
MENRMTKKLWFAPLLFWPVFAGNITPDFQSIVTAPSQAPGVWYVDRYTPAVFQGIGPYQGMTDVLQIGVSAADQQSNRPLAESDAWYNTQGRKYDVGGGAGSYVDMLLYIPAEWQNPANGFFRSDMWATMTDSRNSASAFPVIGFTNYGAAGARYRVFDNSLGWVNLAVPVQYGAWTDFRLTFTGLAFAYAINGADVYSDPNVGTTNGFGNVMVQIYNFGSALDAPGSINNVNAYNYSAYWASSNDDPVPEPGTLGFVSVSGPLLLALGRRRRARR